MPSGSIGFTVKDAKPFAVGDTIEIRRPTTAAWVKFMGMDNLRRDGRPQTWIGTSRSEVAQRTITAISSNRLTVDIPLADSYDAQYLGPTGTMLTKIRPSAVINHVGIEHLHIQCPQLEIAYGQAPYSAVRISGEDCWVRDVYCEETMNSTAISGTRITMENVRVMHTYPNLGASKPTDFSLEGSQILLDRCKITGDNMYFVWTASLYPGPNVVLNCTFLGHGSRVQPHMRWSTGLLVDNCTVPDGGIDFMNRGATGPAMVGPWVGQSHGIASPRRMLFKIRREQPTGQSAASASACRPLDRLMRHRFCPKARSIRMERPSRRKVCIWRSLLSGWVRER